MHWNDDFRLVSDLTQPLVFEAAFVGVCVDWTDCGAACGCCAGLHCDRKVRHPHSHHLWSACKTLSRHAFHIQQQAPGQIEMACCTPYTAIPRKGHQALCRSVNSRGGYSSVSLMCWQTLHRYAEQLLPWRRLEPSCSYAQKVS